ncbi:hypothetical protein CROQUDRAFT_652507 [Cronartium quercuum f. sp. fusiforme G11]|uniref:mitochondrial intermediate peptidase n=1 Tax=Cronartium quercuum f. sp. fusiforme G11 TaxID=708437 RepID=A0A9P6NNB6_9BASI|nr:hypothetical protein CROQUDRAFT_652507 [Cronartium quercuum f. sp. fusiforme G11]
MLKNSLKLTILSPNQNRLFHYHPDHHHLRDVFDCPSLSPSMASTSASLKPTGIFDYPELKTPDNLLSVAKKTVRRSTLIVNRICHSFSPHLASAHPAQPSLDPTTAFVRCVGMFDRLSDGLCRVIDLAELLRNLHPDPDWSHAADEAHDLLCRYMNTLNTHRELYSSLDAALNRVPNAHQDPSLFATRTVALQFLRDFRRHGIHLPIDARARLVDLSDRMLVLGRAFFSGTTHASDLVQLSRSEASALGSSFAHRLQFDSHDKALVDPMDWEGFVLLRQHPQEDVRRRIWMAQNASTEEQVDLLDTLLRTRYDFARLTGKANWAEVALEDKMAGTPENVLTFLTQLSTATKPAACAELTELQRAKARHLAVAYPQIVFPWDRDYYANFLARSPSSGSLTLAPYFSVGTCLQGLSRLFEHIYGISFRVEPTRPGETWNESVVKIGVMDETEGRMGTIYCDLFDRPGKPAGAAHYTVLCSRRTDQDDEQGELAYVGAVNDGLLDDLCLSSDDPGELLKVPVSRRLKRKGTYQRPVVVFSCSFEPPNPDGREPSLLAWSDVETLFHEMGHAMHSMIGQTEYHNVAGTRCPTDLVELPSILMEHFASSPAVVSLFARHHAHGHPLDPHALQIQLAAQARFRALETNAQLVMAAADQHYHSEAVGEPGFESSAGWRDVQARFGVLPPVEGASWQTRFGHLHGYGAGYYSYLFDRAIAARVWENMFESNPLDRDAGERLKTELLQWGGGRDCWEAVGALLRDGRVAEGGREAIGLVGSWGLWKN